MRLSNAERRRRGTPLLSVCVLALPERLHMLRELFSADVLGGWRRADPDVEVLALVDDGQRTIGDKRNALSSICRGVYRTFVDDDDLVSKFYVSRLLEAIRWEGPDNFLTPRAAKDGQAGSRLELMVGPLIERAEAPDVVTFDVELRGHAPHPDGKKVLFRLDADDVDRGDVFMRKPNHLCAWHRAIWSQLPFESSSYGEDTEWASRACALATRHVHVNETLYTYVHNPKGVCADRARSSLGRVADFFASSPPSRDEDGLFNVPPPGPWCASRASEGSGKFAGYCCTRPPGHRGDHVAGNADGSIATRWRNDG